MSSLYVFNCSTNVAGGAVQNSVNFIKEVYRNNEQGLWFFILSKEVFNEVSSLISKDKFFVCKTPAKSLIARFKIKRLVKKINPSLIYTSAGPAYIKFESFHVIGCSNPYVLGPSKQAIELLGNNLNVFLRKLHTIYQSYYFKMADHWILQTKSSAQDFIKKFNLKSENCSIVHNSVTPEFLSLKASFRDLSIENKVKVLVPSAYYPHKNLEIIPSLIKRLQSESEKDFVFYLTISDEKFKAFNDVDGFVEVKKNIVNIGGYSHHQAVSIYNSHDVVFLPSVLEVFSTSYIEAIAMRKPLIVPYLSFSKGVCQSYPLYYEPDSIESCVNAFTKLNEYYDKSNIYTKYAEEITSHYKTQSDRYLLIMNILKRLKTGRSNNV